MLFRFWIFAKPVLQNRGLELALDIEHIMRLGGWESLDMVLRYTRSVRFEESLRVYQMVEGKITYSPVLS